MNATTTAVGNDDHDDTARQFAAWLAAQLGDPPPDGTVTPDPPAGPRIPKPDPSQGPPVTSGPTRTPADEFARAFRDALTPHRSLYRPNPWRRL